MCFVALCTYRRCDSLVLLVILENINYSSFPKQFSTGIGQRTQSAKSEEQQLHGIRTLLKIKGRVKKFVSLLLSSLINNVFYLKKEQFKN
jgi:hypothetical protein